ncbi:MAG: alpha/beta hydrolase [Acidimicrobiales bacterium]|nr:alpha/beta hydrolase [Acidimicrobiales bacterium]
MRPWDLGPLWVPAGYITGELGPVYRWPGMADLADMLPTMIPKHLGATVIPQCGHWTGEECPDEVNDFLLGVLAAL